MTPRDDADTTDRHRTDDPTTDNPTRTGGKPTDRPVPMQPRHGPRPRHLN